MTLVLDWVDGALGSPVDGWRRSGLGDFFSVVVSSGGESESHVLDFHLFLCEVSELVDGEGDSVVVSVEGSDGFGVLEED